ncbi:MAG: hypothetical protein CTY25_05615 [Methylobacterium sp.]|nr:MAG: hypothetical protein CTY25_05615 [Methylobacterium sp.]
MPFVQLVPFVPAPNRNKPGNTMILCTDRGTILVRNQIPPPLRKRTESYFVLRKDGDEWTVSGEVITPEVLHIVSETWHPGLREALAAIIPYHQAYPIQQIYVIDQDASSFNCLMQ